MSWLPNLWTSLHGVIRDTLNPFALLDDDHTTDAEWQRRRANLLVWLQSLETLAQGLGYSAPTPRADTLRATAEQHMPDQIPAWGDAWATITAGAHNALPPESLFDPAQAAPSGVPAWGAIRTLAENAHAPAAVVAHLAERAGAPAPVPHQAVDARYRQWWQARVAQPWTFGPNAPTAHGETPTAPPAPTSAPAPTPAHHHHQAPAAPEGGETLTGTVIPASQVPSQSPAVVPPPEEGGSLFAKFVLGTLIAVGVSKAVGAHERWKNNRGEMTDAALRRARVHRVNRVKDPFGDRRG